MANTRLWVKGKLGLLAGGPQATGPLMCSGDSRGTSPIGSWRSTNTIKNELAFVMNFRKMFFFESLSSCLCEKN